MSLISLPPALWSSTSTFHWLNLKRACWKWYLQGLAFWGDSTGQKDRAWIQRWGSGCLALRTREREWSFGVKRRNKSLQLRNSEVKCQFRSCMESKRPLVFEWTTWEGSLCRGGWMAWLVKVKGPFLQSLEPGSWPVGCVHCVVVLSSITPFSIFPLIFSLKN